MKLPLLVVLDTETTGLGHFRQRSDGIVQIALAYRAPDTGKLSKWSSTSHPGEQHLANGRAAEALRISGLREEEIRAAPPATEVASRTREHLTRLEADYAVELTTYNLGFDRPFLEAAPWSLRGPWADCLMLEAHKHLDPTGKWPKLTEACRRLNIAYPGPTHHAESDAHAALLVHEALTAQRGPRVPVQAAPEVTFLRDGVRGAPGHAQPSR